MTKELLELLDGEVFKVWFLIGAAFVFWMQAGFAMCEAGFTRAKNAGNLRRRWSTNKKTLSTYKPFERQSYKIVERPKRKKDDIITTQNN